MWIRAPEIGEVELPRTVRLVESADLPTLARWLEVLVALAVVFALGVLRPLGPRGDLVLAREEEG